MSQESWQEYPNNQQSRRNHITYPRAILMSVLAINAGALAKNQLETPAYSQGSAPIEASPTPTPATTSESLSVNDAFEEYEGTGMTPQEICRGAALGAIAGVAIDIKKDPKRKGKQELVWSYTNNFMPEGCESENIGSWAVKLSLRPKIAKLAKPYIIKNGKKVRTNSITIQNPTQDHGTYKSIMYLKGRFPSPGKANDPDKDDTLWTPTGGETEVRRHYSMATVTYRAGSRQKK